MKYYTFYRENNNFDDILKDSTIKNKIVLKLSWYQYLMIGLPTDNDRQFSYITLKYGDDLTVPDVQDFTPIPNKDYIPKKDANRFKKKS